MEIKYTAEVVSSYKFENLGTVPGSGFAFNLEFFKAGLGLVSLGEDPTSFGEGIDWANSQLDPTIWNSTHFLDYGSGELAPFSAVSRPNSFDGILDYAGASGFTQNSMVIDYTNTSTLTGAAELSFFTTAGTVTLNDFNTVLESFIVYGGTNKTVSDTLKSGSVETTYHFTPVPEVSSSVLLGLAGSMAFRRRRISH